MHMGKAVKNHLDIWTKRKLAVAGQLTRQAIDDYTVEKLCEVVRYAVENSSFYRWKFCCMDKKAGSLKQSFMETFRGLPFTTPEELCGQGMEFLCVKPGEISRIVTLDTGGSTGAPKRVYFTEDDQQLTVDFFQNGMQLLASPEDTVLILMPAKVPGSIGKLLGQGLRNFGAKAVEYGLPNMRPSLPKEEDRMETMRILELMRTKEITCVVALPTHMRMLAEAALATGGNEGARPLKSVLLSAEYVPKDAARMIERVFGCKVYEHYGMTEMGLGCAVSCGFGTGYHVREADLYLEIIDPQTGNVVQDGEPGEIVFTTLTRTGMPLIRYRTGDYSRWITSPCACGSILKRLDKVGVRDVKKGYLR